MPALQFEVTDKHLGIITFDQPDSRANTLAQEVFVEFQEILKELRGRTDLEGLILRSGKPGMFIAGADIRQFAALEGKPDLTRQAVELGHSIVGGFEELPYPTMALVDGSCLGGGLEVALGFDYRLAGTHPKTELGLPEVKLGLIPGWGGTQRLTRLLGPALAAELICAGDTARAARARELGLVFDVVPSDKLIEEADRILAWSRASNDWQAIRERKRLPVGLSEEQLSFVYAVAQGHIMAKTQGKIPAPLAALEAITKGCNRPLEDGLKIEAEAFIPLVGSPVSKNLIAVFFMNQRIQKDPGVEDPSIQPKNVNNVGVLGAGIMGSGIAGAHIRRAVPTLMIDQDTSAIDKGVSAIGKVMKSRIDIGRMTEEDMFAALARLSTATNTKLLAEADVIVEAVVENESVKTELFKQLHDVVKDDAIVASNTSTISITRMAQAAPNPSRFAGMHFFNPVDRMPLVEVIRGEKTDDHTVATLVALAKRIGKSPIVVRDCPGFLVNRVLFPYLNEALFLLEEGADPRTVDKVATDFGMPMGPITLHDVVGLDTSLYAGQVIKTAYPDRAVESNILDHLVKIGRLGKKSGAGFYNYAKSSRGTDDAQLTQILDACRTDRRDISTNEISDRLFLSMLVESSRALSEEIVRTPADVDMGLVLGIGFPTFLGGILRWADAVGLATVVDKLKPFQKLGKRFEPTEQMAELAAARKGFYDT